MQDDGCNWSWGKWLCGPPGYRAAGKVYAWLALKNVPFKENQLIPHITETFSQGHCGSP